MSSIDLLLQKGIEQLDYMSQRKSISTKRAKSQYQKFITTMYAVVSRYSDKRCSIALKNGISRDLRDHLTKFKKELINIMRYEIAHVGANQNSMMRKHLRDLNQHYIEDEIIKTEKQDIDRLLINLMHNSEYNIERYIDSVESAYIRQLSLGAIKKSKISDILSILHKLMPINGSGPFSARLLTIYRTDICQAVNLVNQYIINKVLGKNGMEIIINPYHSNSHPISKKTHLLVKKVGSDSYFEVEDCGGSGVLWEKTKYGYKGLTLPSHFNGGGVIMPYNPKWEITDNIRHSS